MLTGRGQLGAAVGAVWSISILAAGAADLPVHWQRGGHAGGCQDVIYAPDGTELVSASWDGTIKFWRRSDGRLLRTLASFGTPAVLEFSPDGRHLAVASVYDVQLWDLATGVLERVLDEHASLVSDIEFSPDGQWVATLGSFDGMTILRHASDWSPVHVLPLPPGLFWHSPMTIVFTQDSSTVFTSAFTGEVNEFRVADGAHLRSLGDQGVPVPALAISPDGALLLSGNDNGTVRRWSLPSGTALAPIAAHSGGITELEFSPDGARFLTASADNTARIWRTSDGALLQTLAGHNDDVDGAAFSPDGHEVATCAAYADRNLRLWRVADGQLLGKLTEHTDTVNSVSFAPDMAVMVSGAADGQLKFWDTTAGTQVQIIPAAHDQAVRHVAFSPAGSLVASCANGTGVRIWSYPGMSLIRTLAGHTDWVSEIAFSPDGQLLASIGDSDAKLWRVSDGQLLHTLGGYATALNALAFSPDGSVLAASGGEVIKFWRVSDGMLLDTLNGHTDWVAQMAFSPDGETLASGGADRTVRLWRVSDGELQHTLVGPTRNIFTVAFAPDGRTVVSGGWDAKMFVWRVADGTLLGTYDSPVGTGVQSLTFSQDGLQLGMGRYDAVVALAHRPPVSGGDMDLDGDVDPADHAAMADCLTGPLPDQPLPAGCGAAAFAYADLDGDGDVDLADERVLQQVFTGTLP